MGVRNVVDSTYIKEGSKEFYCKNSGCTYSYKEVIKKGPCHKTIPRKEHVLDSEMPSHSRENPFMQSHADVVI